MARYDMMICMSGFKSFKTLLGCRGDEGLYLAFVGMEIPPAVQRLVYTLVGENIYA